MYDEKNKGLVNEFQKYDEKFYYFNKPNYFIMPKL